LKPKSPTLMLIKSAPSVEATKPAADRLTMGRGHANRATARAKAAMASTRNRGPFVGMNR